MSNRVVSFDDLPGLVGTNLGYTDWLEVTQDRIDQFAVATGDSQWIHTDPVRAAEGPFGGTVAHGFLTLSLLIPFWGELFDVDGVTTKVNYGLDRVRFTAPVRSGAKIRMTATLEQIREINGGVQIHASATIEIQGSDRPALVAEFLTRFYA